MATTEWKFNPKNMPFRLLGNSGLRVPLLSLGTWLTIGVDVQGGNAKDLIKTAYEHGINMFDSAESYGSGKAEEILGSAVKELGIRRSDLVITTKLFFGSDSGSDSGPNNGGLSFKHIVEGTQGSLRRLQMDYVDVMYAHRPDRATSIEETVRAFNHIINRGWAFYWGTSEWSAWEIAEAYRAAEKLCLSPPVVEQCQYNMFHRERPEVEYAPLYDKYDFGIAVFSPLAGGLLTDKYAGGEIPKQSRFEQHGQFYQGIIRSFDKEEGRTVLRKIDELEKYAEKEFNCGVNQLAIAWLAKKRSTNTIILGAKTRDQLLQNIQSLDVIHKMTDEHVRQIEQILENAPPPPRPYGIFKLDVPYRAAR